VKNLPSSDPPARGRNWISKARPSLGGFDTASTRPVRGDQTAPKAVACAQDVLIDSAATDPCWQASGRPLSRGGRSPRHRGPGTWGFLAAPYDSRTEANLGEGRMRRTVHRMDIQGENLASKSVNAGMMTSVRRSERIS